MPQLKQDEVAKQLNISVRNLHALIGRGLFPASTGRNGRANTWEQKDIDSVQSTLHPDLTLLVPAKALALRELRKFEAYATPYSFEPKESRKHRHALRPERVALATDGTIEDFKTKSIEILNGHGHRPVLGTRKSAKPSRRAMNLHADRVSRGLNDVDDYLIVHLLDVSDVRQIHGVISQQASRYVTTTSVDDLAAEQYILGHYRKVPTIIASRNP